MGTSKQVKRLGVPSFGCSYRMCPLSIRSGTKFGLYFPPSIRLCTKIGTNVLFRNRLVSRPREQLMFFDQAGINKPETLGKEAYS